MKSTSASWRKIKWFSGLDFWLLTIIFDRFSINFVPNFVLGLWFARSVVMFLIRSFRRGGTGMKPPLNPFDRLPGWLVLLILPHTQRISNRMLNDQQFVSARKQKPPFPQFCTWIYLVGSHSTLFLLRYQLTITFQLKFATLILQHSINLDKDHRSLSYRHLVFRS